MQLNRWIVLFNDAREMLAVREKNFADPVAYLTAQRENFSREPLCQSRKELIKRLACGECRLWSEKTLQG